MVTLKPVDHHVPDHIAIPEQERFYPAWDPQTFGPRTWRGPKT